MNGARARAAIGLGLTLAFVAGCGDGGNRVGGSPSGTPDPTLTRNAASVDPGRGFGRTPFRFYSPTSFWNSAVSSDAKLDPRSPAIVAALAKTVASELSAGKGPAINTTDYSVPIYTVPKGQPTVRVHLDHRYAPALQAAWRAVPIPPSAQPAAGTDHAMVIWQPGTDRLWDFWRADHEADGWHASWGGATRHVSTASGIPGRGSWPGAKPFWGTSGASIGVVGGLITLEDLELGTINHALQMAVPEVRASFYTWPAQRTDGKSTDPTSLPEGAHLRLDPRLDLAKLGLPPLTLMIARAAQRYGIFVNNASANVAFSAQDPTPIGVEPYRGPNGYFEGSYPRALLSTFPWRHLQLLRMKLRTGPPAVEGGESQPPPEL